MKHFKDYTLLAVLIPFLIGVIGETAIGISIRKEEKREASKYEYLYRNSSGIDHFMNRKTFEEVTFKKVN